MDVTDFGHAARAAFPLEPGLLYLNHGTVGVPPIRVLEAQRAIRDTIERNPSKFLLRELAEVGVDQPEGHVPHMRQAAAKVAEFAKVSPSDLVFVDNATTGINAVLRSFAFAPTDAIAVTSLGYGAVNHAAAYVARERGIEVNTIPMPFSVDGPQALIDAFEAGLAPNAAIAVIDHVCSDSGLQWPVEALVAICRRNGTRVLIDGAHTPGCLPLDVAAVGADYYVANLHKWAWSPRSSAFLWARPDVQEGLHPVVISWGLDRGFTAEFDLVGTRDPTPHLAAPEGLAMLNEIGIDRVLAHNHALVREGVGILEAATGGRSISPPELMTSMASVVLPARFGTTFEQMLVLRNTLLYVHGIEVATACREGRVSVRLGAQIYNEASDFERLAGVLRAL